jgi:hypothetical protein
MRAVMFRGALAIQKNRAGQAALPAEGSCPTRTRCRPARALPAIYSCRMREPLRVGVTPEEAVWISRLRRFPPAQSGLFSGQRASSFPWPIAGITGRSGGDDCRGVGVLPRQCDRLMWMRPGQTKSKCETSVKACPPQERTSSLRYRSAQWLYLPSTEMLDHAARRTPVGHLLARTSLAPR